MIILGLNADHADAAAAIVVDGKLVAAAEGRVIPAYEPEDLPNAIKEAFEQNRKRKESGGEE